MGRFTFVGTSGPVSGSDAATVVYTIDDALSVEKISEDDDDDECDDGIEI